MLRLAAKAARRRPPLSSNVWRQETMRANQFIERSRDPARWRKHARNLRDSAEYLWIRYTVMLTTEVKRARESQTAPDFELVIDALETAKLVYGLALETALKAWIIERHPEKIEIRVVMDGAGETKQAELRAIGVPASQGHNLLSLGEAAGIFEGEFQNRLTTELDQSTLKNICRDLSDVVQWRGRYPVPLVSGGMLQLDPDSPSQALHTHLLDWLLPLLDALLASDGG